MGGDKKTTIMVLKVDLQCSKCYKKIKRVLCQLPQIHDQVFDEKANTVTIKVVCCSPECVKKKIISKAGDTLKGIDIKVPEKPKAPEKPKEPEKPKAPEKPKEPEKPKAPEKPKEPEKPKAPEKPKEPEKPKDAPPKPKEPEKPKEAPPAKPKEPEKPKPTPPPAAMVPAPAPGYPPAMAFPYRTCCPDCNDGRPGGPCFYGCVPAGPPPCYQYDGYYGRPVYDSYGGGRNYQVNRCDYFSEENTGACAIM